MKKVKIGRVWDVNNKKYIDDISSVCDITISNNDINIDIAEGFILERIFGVVEDQELFEGDLIYIYNYFGVLLDYYTIEKDNNWYCVNSGECRPLSDFVDSYTIKKIDSYRIIDSVNKHVVKNVCIQCMEENIIIQPKDAMVSYCEKCGCLY